MGAPIYPTPTAESTGVDPLGPAVRPQPFALCSILLALDNLLNSRRKEFEPSRFTEHRAQSKEHRAQSTEHRGLKRSIWTPETCFYNITWQKTQKTKIKNAKKLSFLFLANIQQLINQKDKKDKRQWVQLYFKKKINVSILNCLFCLFCLFYTFIPLSISKTKKTIFKIKKSKCLFCLFFTQYLWGFMEYWHTKKYLPQ